MESIIRIDNTKYPNQWYWTIRVQ